MELRRLWSLVWNRKLLIGVLVVAALVAGYKTIPKIARYQTTAVLFVGLSQSVFNDNTQIGQQYAAVTFASMVTEFNIAEAAVAATGVPRSPGQVAAETRAAVVPGTTLIHLTVTDVNPVVAQTIANGLAQAFVTEMRQLYPITTSTSGQKVPASPPVTISETAGLPAVPLSNGASRTLVLSGIFGLLVGIGLVLLLDYLDLSVREPEDLESHIGLPLLGVIPLFPPLPERESLIAGTALRPPPLPLERLDG